MYVAGCEQEGHQCTYLAVSKGASMYLAGCEQGAINISSWL